MWIFWRVFSWNIGILILDFSENIFWRIITFIRDWLKIKVGGLSKQSLLLHLIIRRPDFLWKYFLGDFQNNFFQELYWEHFGQVSFSFLCVYLRTTRPTIVDFLLIFWLLLKQYFFYNFFKIFNVFLKIVKLFFEYFLNDCSSNKFSLFKKFPSRTINIFWGLLEQLAWIC